MKNEVFPFRLYLDRNSIPTNRNFDWADKNFCLFLKTIFNQDFLWYGVILCVLSVLTRTLNLPPIYPITHNLPIFICSKQKKLQKKFIFKQLSECLFNCLVSILEDQSKNAYFEFIRVTCCSPLSISWSFELVVLRSAFSEANSASFDFWSFTWYFKSANSRLFVPPFLFKVVFRFLFWIKN